MLLNNAKLESICNSRNRAYLKRHNTRSFPGQITRVALVQNTEQSKRIQKRPSENLRLFETF